MGKSIQMKELLRPNNNLIVNLQRNVGSTLLSCAAVEILCSNVVHASAEMKNVIRHQITGE
jgi:hypothetical protein